MTPKQWIKHIRYLEKNKLALCDGTTQEMGGTLFPVLLALFSVSGLYFFTWLIIHRQKLKKRFFKNEKNK